MEINVGDKVRSFDFPSVHRDLEGHDACFVEGVVVGITDPDNHSEFGIPRDCPRYKVVVSRQVWQGRDVTPSAREVFPPVNGTPGLFSLKADGVVLI